MISTKIERAAKSLSEHINGKYYDADSVIAVIGIADNELVVYLQKKGYAKKVPKEWEGYPVKSHFTGQFRLL